MPDRQNSSITGSVDRVTHHNEENGFAILRVRVPDRSEPVTVRGHLPAVNEGEQLAASGRWVTDPKYGRQFHADHVETAPPSSLLGIERYLASDLIEGIGKKYARLLVEKFGEGIFDIIDHYSQRLEEVDGIGRKRRQTIKASWEKQKAIRDIMVFLYDQGIGTAHAVRIYKQYGDNAIGVLETDPYQLSQDVWGIGFKSADQIARNLGIQRDAPQRIDAGTLHVLREATGQGHCALPEDELLTQAAQILDVDDPGAVRSALDRLLQNETLVRDTIAGAISPLIFLPELREAEIAVATIIRRLADAPPRYPAIDAEKALAWMQEKTGIALGEQQQHAVTESLRNRVLIITGGPGVGKTTIVNGILRILTAKRVRPVLCAPTGRAAKRLSESTGRDAATIHRLLEYQPAKGFTRDPGNPLEGDLFVMDETSMVDVPLMRHFLRALPENAHLILVGDIDQLPSVGPGNLLRDLIASDTVNTVRLTEIFRQAAGSDIIRAAHEINAGRIPPLIQHRDHEHHHPREKHDFYFIERIDPEAIASTIVTLIGKRLPDAYRLDPARDIQLLTPMNRGPLGTAAFNQHLQATLNPPHEFKHEAERFGIIYRAGDKVIQTRNNYDKDVYNGDIGTITRIATHPTKVRVQFDDTRAATYEPSELDELRLAYAITIHKSQGSEFPVVVIPVSTQHYVMLQRNLLYTGLTRGKRLVVLVGDPKALSIAINNTDTARRHSALLERLQTPNTQPPISK